MSGALRRAKMGLMSNTVEQVGPEEATELIAGGAALVDVREPGEWQVGRAPQAIHIPLAELGARLDELPADRTLVIVCRSGARSQAAAAALVDAGLPAVNLEGGMQAWQAASLPVVADGDLAGEVA
jgi:rhodanese-related sulfurtransferase